MPRRVRSLPDTEQPPDGPESPQEGLHLGEGSYAVALKMRARGIDLDAWARRPPEKLPPELPADVTAMADPSLMRLFTKLSRWTRYLGVQVAAAQVDESCAARDVAKTKAAKADPVEISGYEDALTEAKAYHTMIKALFSVTDRDYKLISREITRRTGRGPQESRGNRAEEEE